MASYPQKYMDAIQRDRPMRLAADLAFAAWQHNGGRLSFEKAVPPLFRFIIRIGAGIGLKANDLIIMHVLLRRYYRNVHDARARLHTIVDGKVAGERPGDSEARKLLEYDAAHTLKEKALHACWISQTLIYDAPLVKRVWVKHAEQPWHDFVNSGLQFASCLSFRLLFDDSEYISAYNDLVFNVEVEAKPRYLAMVSPIPGAVDPALSADEDQTISASDSNAVSAEQEAPSQAQARATTKGGKTDGIAPQYDTVVEPVLVSPSLWTDGLTTKVTTASRQSASGQVMVHGSDHQASHKSLTGKPLPALPRPLTPVRRHRLSRMRVAVVRPRNVNHSLARAMADNSLSMRL